MKKLFAFAIMFILQGLFCFAASAETGITVAVSQTDNVFTVSGETGAEKEVTILMTSPAGTICYADQAESDVNGRFSFEFLMPPGAASGEYTVRVGGEDVSVPYETTVAYSNGVPPLQVTMNDANIIVEGNLQTGTKKSVTILVTGPGSRIYYADQINSDAFGMYKFDFLLPPSAANGEYTISVGGEGVDVPYQTTVTYSGGLPPVRVALSGDVITVDGNLQTGAGQAVTILVRSPLGSIAYADQIESDINGLYRFEFLLPPMSVNGIYTVTVGGEGIETPYAGEFTYTNGTDVLSQTMELKNIAANAERKLFIRTENMRNLEYKTFTLTYDPAKLQVKDLCLFTYEKEQKTGHIDGTHITITEFNAQTGVIKFTLDIANGETAWNGTLGGIQFVGRQSRNVTVRFDVTPGNKK